MIELEIQGLSVSREGLLIEIGRLVVANGFTLQRQRLVQDPHGVLMTLVVRGPARKRRSLEAALDASDRFVSTKIFPFDENETRPHFAASRKLSVAPPTMPVAAPLPAVTPPTSEPVTAPVVTPPPASTEPSIDEADIRIAAAPEMDEAPVESEFEFLLPQPSTPKRTSAPVEAAPVEPPFVELVELEPDVAAVDKALRSLEYDYPKIVPKLQELERSVVAGARQSSLVLAGQRTGAWAGGREGAGLTGLDLPDALERLGVPALAALVEVDNQAGQLHIHHSPLCTESGQSGCGFFSGFLEGLLAPAIAPRELMIIAVCCRSYGADECVLAISE